MKHLAIFLSLNLWLFGAFAQSWTPIGPFGGVVRSGLSLGSDLFIGTSAGIYKSTDNGISYQAHSKGIPSGPILDLIQDGNHLFACVWDKGIYRSEDGGITWTRVLKGNFLRQDTFGQLKIQKVGDHIMVRAYGTSDSLYFSNDAGVSWTRRRVNNTMFNNVYGAGNSLFTFSNGTLGPQPGLYRSDDLGQNWSFSAAGMPASSFIANVLAFGDTLYALNHHIFRSLDGGANWTKVTTDSIPGSVPGSPFVPGWVGVSGRTIFGQTGGNASLKVATWTPGQSGWTALDAGLAAIGNTNTFFAHNNQVYLARVEGLYTTGGPGQAWTTAPLEGVNGIPVRGVFAKGNQAMATSRPNVLTATQTAGQWTVSNPTNISDMLDLNSIIRIGNKTLMGVRNSFGILDLYHSADQGATWTKGSAFNIAATASFLEKGDSLIIYGSRGGTPACFVSDLSGNEVSNLSTGLFGWSFNDGVPSMTAHKGYLYVVITSFGSPFSIIRRYPLASGTFWEGVREKIDNQFFGATAIASWKDTLYLGMINGGVKISADDGLNWTNLNAGLDSAIVSQFHVFGDFMAIASDRGVFLRETGDTAWTNLSANLPAGNVARVSTSDQYLWALLENGGVWRWPLGGNVAIDRQVLPLDFSLAPNPTTGWLRLERRDSEAGTLRLLDSSGREVMRRTWHVGQSRIEISVADLPAGLYLCLLQSGGRSGVQRFVKE